MLQALLRCLPDGELLSIPAASGDLGAFRSLMQQVIKADRTSSIPLLLIPVTVHARIIPDQQGVTLLPALRPAAIASERLVLVAPGPARSEARESPDLDHLLAFARQNWREGADWLVCSWTGGGLSCGMGRVCQLAGLRLPITPGRYGFH